MLGVPIEDTDRFRTWSDELLEAQSTGLPRGLYDTHPTFGAYIQGLIDERRSHSSLPDDVITRLMQSEADAEQLSDRAICTQTMNLIIAGNETTRNLIGNCLYALAADPALYSEIRADATLCSALVEESLRHDSPIQVLARAVLADTDVEDFPLRKGDRVVFGLASANRDEARYKEPAEFRMNRPRPRDHLAFGTGAHVCPGASLARLETVVVLETFLERVDRVALADGFTPVPNPVFWALGHRSLPVTLTPRTT
jgi:cytochrome P450